MNSGAADHGLAFLLAFDGRIHRYEGGYWVKFEIKRSAPTLQRPHGLSYCFTLHDPDGTRLLGFDNAHAVRPRGARFKKKSKATDHWHRDHTDKGRPYEFTDAAVLIKDFMDEVEEILAARGISLDVVGTE